MYVQIGNRSYVLVHTLYEYKKQHLNIVFPFLLKKHSLLRIFHTAVCSDPRLILTRLELVSDMVSASFFFFLMIDLRTAEVLPEKITNTGHKRGYGEEYKVAVPRFEAYLHSVNGENVGII